MTESVSRQLVPFKAAFKAAQAGFADALPATIGRYLTPERITRMTLAAVGRDYKLLECTPESVLKATMEAVGLGLEPCGGAMGHAYLVPYKTTATLIIGYRGYIELARRSGNFKSVEAHVVRAGDGFECSFGRDPVLRHTPSLEGGRDVIAGYVVAEFTNGGAQVELMTVSEIDAIRARSYAANNGPWVSDYDEMARKTVVRRAAKYWPLSAELAQAMNIEREGEILAEAEFVEAPGKPPEGTRSFGAKRLPPKAERGGLVDAGEPADFETAPADRETKPATEEAATSQETADPNPLAAQSAKAAVDMIEDILATETEMIPRLRLVIGTDDRKTVKVAAKKKLVAIEAHRAKRAAEVSEIAPELPAFDEEPAPAGEPWCKECQAPHITNSTCATEVVQAKLNGRGF